jgi:hypothetical protein
MHVLSNQRVKQVLYVFCALAVSAGSFGIVLHGQTRRPAASAAPAQPQIVVGGIQVAKVAVASDDFSAKPFNSDNGTKIVLWIKMPPGQGLIEIDEDASVLQLFGDDKGTDLGGKLDSFPDEFKDGSGGTMDITSSGMPAAGATKLVAEGTLSLNIAAGSKPQRVTNVALQDARTFKLGQTTITVAEVSADGEDQKFTLKLPRQVMAGIKGVSFFDAKNQPLDGHRTSSGYFNNDAEMGFTVKTALKTVTIEFDVWQGLRVIKVPFKVSAGVGLVE